MIRPSIYSLIRSLIRTFCKYLGFTVTAYYPSGEIFKHYCFGWSEAVDWMRQYPAECDVTITQYLSTQCVVRFVR